MHPARGGPLVRQRWYYRYGAAVVLAAAALAARLALQPWLGDQIPFLTFFPAAALLAWYAGPGPAALAVVLGLVGANYFFFFSPYGRLGAGPVTVVLLQLFYLAVTALIIVFAVLARRRTATAEAAAANSRAAAEALDVARAEMKAVLDNVPTVIYHLDAADRFVFANRRYEELLGLTSAELLGKHIGEIFPADIAARLSANNREVLAARRTLSFEEEATVGGEHRVYSSIKTPLPRADGAPGVLGLSTDITLQKRTEARLRESEAGLRETDRRKDEFLAMLSHELRNPLAPISTAVQFLELKEPAEPSVQSALQIIARQVKVMSRLVDDLLDLSRLSSGRIDLRRERVDVSIAIHDALQVSRPLIEQARHELVVRLPAEPLYVDGDLVRLSQIVSNLVNNAAKYTPPGGRIEVTLAGEADRIAIAVTDNGIGVPPDMIGRIFEMFAQVDASTARSHGGLGIGLTFAQQLAKMHGGHIEVESAGVDRGSTFTVYLPRAGGAVSEEYAAQPDVERVSSSFRVLVADDNVDAAQSLGLLLEARGLAVQLAHDGVEAVEAARAFAPALVLLDIGMPRLNGYDAAKRIRALPRGSDMRLVAVTGWGQAGDRERSFAAGFDEHVTKPVDAAHLDGVLARVALHSASERREAARHAGRGDWT